MSSIVIKTFAKPGVQTFPHALDVTVASVTVNGSAATITDANGVCTVSSPTLAGGETVALTCTRLQPAAYASRYAATFTA